MATINVGILGGFSGKVGTVVGSIWKGICTMRAMPASVSQPNTPAQLEQRAKFKAVGSFLHPLTAFLRIGFKSKAIKMTAHNAAMSYNLENAISGSYPSFAVDYSKALVSEGIRAGALNPEAASTVAGEINFTWDDNSTAAEALATDKVMLVVYNPGKAQAITVAGGNTRQSGSQTLTLPDFFSGDTVECYVSFQTANQSEVSNSQYAGSVLVA